MKLRAETETMNTKFTTLKPYTVKQMLGMMMSRTADDNEHISRRSLNISSTKNQQTSHLSNSSNMSSNAHRNISGLATDPYIIPFNIGQVLSPTLIAV